ncbi:MAG: hypothetical protein JWL90_2149 [Chthoniobacteraceae bacterium]|nr:hypothetical protein [Chthoniobacteraceae bacterium]
MKSSSSPRSFMHFTWFLPLALMSVSTSALAQAVIEGRVLLSETRSAPVMNKRYEIVSKGGVLATNPPLAVVYLEGDFARAIPAHDKKVEQKEMAFLPALLPVQVGTRVEFPNLDETFHNIFSFSPAKRFDLGRYRPDERPIPAQIFDKPGLITLRCDIHEHMRGLILVLATPHFVVTDPDGHFQIKGLPAGRFRLKAWMSSKTTLEKEVELKNGSTMRVDFP